MSTLLNPSYTGRVEVQGGLGEDVIALGKIDMLGESPNASVVLYQYEPAVKGKGDVEYTPARWKVVDRLTEAEITGSEKTFTVRGVSDQLVGEVQVASREDAIATWTVVPKGCVDCR